MQSPDYYYERAEEALAGLGPSADNMIIASIAANLALAGYMAQIASELETLNNEIRVHHRGR